MKIAISAVVAAISLCAPVAFAQQAGHGKQGGGSEKMMQAMQEGMKDMQSMPMSGDTDKDFAMMMRKHHQDGIKVAQAQLESGKDPKMREMAKKIVESQRKETREFDEWLAKHK